MKKKIGAFILGIMALVSMVGCSSEADTVSHNLSKDADSFKVERRIIFFNGITDKYLMTIEGKCALGNSDKKGEKTVTCKVGEDQYKKHYLGLSDNVSFFVEQTDANYEDAYHYKVLFRPETIKPDIELQISK